jgi:hypothetical protein
MGSSGRRSWSHGVQVRSRTTNGPGAGGRARCCCATSACATRTVGRYVSSQRPGRSSSPRTMHTGWWGCCIKARRYSSGVLAHRRGIPVGDPTISALSEVWSLDSDLVTRVRGRGVLISSRASTGSLPSRVCSPPGGGRQGAYKDARESTHGRASKWTHRAV